MGVPEKGEAPSGEVPDGASPPSDCRLIRVRTTVGYVLEPLTGRPTTPRMPIAVALTESCGRATPIAALDNGRYRPSGDGNNGQPRWKRLLPAPRGRRG